MRLTLLLNSSAGTLRGLDPLRTAEELAEIFREQGHSVRTEVRHGREAVAAITRICREGGCDGIIVGGGDGTVSAAAAAAAQSGVVLGVLPLGTMNLFARALGLPLEMRQAAHALAASEPVAVDICEVNGRFFVHHLTLGLHPRLIRIRERMSYGSRWGKILANAQALLVVLRQPPRLIVRLRIDGATVERRTAAVVLSNNPFGEGHLPYADDLRQGKLGLYVSSSRGWTQLVQLAAGVLLGEIAANPRLESWFADRVEVHLSRPNISASLDGEIVSLHTPLLVRSLYGGLTVLQPAKEPSEPRMAGRVGIASEVNHMNETLNKTEARQGDRRRMTKTVVLLGTPLAFILLGLLFWVWA